MSITVNWKRSSTLKDGAALAPTDTGVVTGVPSLEDGELAVNTSAEDPCLWLRKADDTLAKFRPTAGVRVVDKATDLAVPGTPQAKALKSGDAFLVRFTPNGTTPENRLVVWDEQINSPGPVVGGVATTIAGGWNWAVEPRNFIKQLAAAADVATTGTAGHKLVEGDLQLTIEPGIEELKVYTKGVWVTIFSWQRLRDNFPTNQWAARVLDLPVPVVGQSITDGSTYMVRLDLDGQPLDRMMVWRELTAETVTTAGVAVPQTGEWHIVDQTTWVKSLNSDRDNTTDAKGGDLTVTLEKGKESIKVFDAKAGAWVTVPATDSETVRSWIASLSLFQGTVVENGTVLPGAIDFDALPDLSDPKLASLKALSAHYWIFVGASGTTIRSTDPNGLGRDVNGARLNPGDWIMISNRSTDPAVVDAHWVTVSGDLLSATRARALYSHETWRPGSYETGTVIVHNKSLWRALSAVRVSDGEPVDGVNVAQVETIDLTVATGLAAGADFTIRVDGHTATYTTQVVSESAAVITAKLITALNTEPLITALVKVEAGMVTGGVVDPANAQIKLTALTAGVPFTVTVSRTELAITHVKANVTVSPWVRLDLAAGVRWVPTDAERDAIINLPRQDIIYVLSSAEARGNGALYYYDSANTKWMSFGKGDTPLKLDGGIIVYPDELYWDGTGTKPNGKVIGDLLYTAKTNSVERWSGTAWVDILKNVPFGVPANQDKFVIMDTAGNPSLSNETFHDAVVKSAGPELYSKVIPPGPEPVLIDLGDNTWKVARIFGALEVAGSTIHIFMQGFDQNGTLVTPESELSRIYATLQYGDRNANTVDRSRFLYYDHLSLTWGGRDINSGDGVSVNKAAYPWLDLTITKLYDDYLQIRWHMEYWAYSNVLYSMDAITEWSGTIGHRNMQQIQITGHGQYRLGAQFQITKC